MCVSVCKREKDGKGVGLIKDKDDKKDKTITQFKSFKIMKLKLWVWEEKKAEKEGIEVWQEDQVDKWTNLKG